MRDDRARMDRDLWMVALVAGIVLSFAAALVLPLINLMRDF